MADATPFSPDEVAHRTFATSFRGFDPGEVRAFLGRLAEHLRELEGRLDLLRGQAADAEERARHPQLDVETLTSALGDETARILRSAQDAAHDIRAKAEDNIAQLLREAYEEAGRIRAEAETVLARETEMAEAAAEELRTQAEADAAAALGRAREEAERVLAEVEARARQLVEEAEARRAKVLTDLARRRRVAHLQVEQLRAGRERLLESYRLVRTTLDEVTDDLRRAETEAREAAEEAAHRVGEEAAVEEEPVAADEGHDEVGGEVPLAAELRPPGEEAPPPVEEVAAAEVAGEEVAGEEGASEEPELVPRPEPLLPPDAVPPSDAEPPSEPGPAAEPAPAVARAHEERRLSSLRIIRRPKPEPAFVPVAPPAADEYEGVRIIKPEPEPEPVSVAEDPPLPEEEQPAADDAPEPDALSPAAPEPAPAAAPATAGAAVDDLFARIRADRADAVARARVVLEEPAPAPAPEPAPTAAPEPTTDRLAPDEDEALLQRRDAAVEDVEQRLARRLKRALQDEQNDVLDRLRLHRGRPAAAAVLPSPDEHAARYREVAADLLREAAAAGAAFVGGPPTAPAVALDDLTAGLAEEVVAPLRRRLERSLEEGADEEHSLVVERVNAAYRETKGRRIEELASDHVVAAFSRAAVASAPDGSSFRWVVDDGDGSCPDCDDNALAGPTSKGDTFPTGQAHPPAHSGCRCLLVLTGT